MRIFGPFLTISISVHLAIADILLGAFPLTVNIGSTYQLNWTAAANYTYDIWLVLQEGSSVYDWDKVSTLAQGVNYGTTAQYEWTVPELNTSDNYGIWLTGFPTLTNGTTYTNITDYFAVRSASTTPTISTSSTGTPSSKSTTSPTQESKVSSKLSGGAIAGIVVGVLAVIVLGILGGVLIIWRRRKIVGEREEAARRHSRLEPVMKGQSAEHDYELQRRSIG